MTDRSTTLVECKPGSGIAPELHGTELERPRHEPVFELGPEIGRAELERLRRGELGAEALAAWTHRARALALAPAPKGVPLPADGTGHLLAVGTPWQRLYPRWSARFGLLMAPGTMLALLSPDLLGMDHPVIRMAWVGLLTASFALALTQGRRRLHRWNPRRRLARAETPHTLAGVAPGSYVRVAGTVALQPTVPSLFENKPSVLSRSRLGQADETRGIDFLLDLAGGEQVKVQACGAFLLDEPSPSVGPPACGPVSAHEIADENHRLFSDLLADPPPDWLKVDGRRYETSIGPGDAVEVLGVLGRTPSAEGQGGPMRATPLLLTLSAAPDCPLLVARDAAKVTDMEKFGQAAYRDRP